jgi:AbrB family looped-hinge helix DNA binding protein
MRVTTKGQVTIPGPIRRKLDIQPGDDVRFVEEGDRVVVLKANLDVEEEAARFEHLLDQLTGLARDSGVTSTDEALDILRGSDRRD